MPKDLPRLTGQAQQAWAAIDHSRELVSQAHALNMRLECSPFRLLTLGT